MTSILTNSGATSALQVLRSISTQLGETQRQVSSGLRIGTASDNAAYWSIATTMRSDNMALSAVQDALGLGAAKVDTAYAGMTAVVDVLKEFKAKLVAAHEEGVDKTKIQGELEQLKQQVVGVSKSASFSGENWLDVDVDLAAAKGSVVSSFVRDDAGGVSVKKVEVSVAEVALFNRVGGAILQERYEIIEPEPTTPDGMGLLDVGGLEVDPFIMGIVSAEARFSGVLVTWPIVFGPTDEISFDVNLNDSIYGPGQFGRVTVNQSVISAALGTADGSIPYNNELRAVLNYAFSLSSLGVTSNAALGSGSVSIGLHPQQGTSIGHSILVSNVTSNLPGGFAFGLDKPPLLLVNNPYPSESFSFTSGFEVVDDASFSFDVALHTIGGGPMTITTYTVTKADVDAALGTGDGQIRNATDYATLLSYKTAGSGLDFNAIGNNVEITIDPAVRPYQGLNATFIIDDIRKQERTTVPPPLDPDDLLTFDFLGIDITNENISLRSYLSAIEEMLEKTISGASILGSLKLRIDMQSEFVSKLTDSIDSGIGRLVDADMNEASTRLKALQTQEQLAIQSLSIANTNAENVMTLFR